MEKAQAQTILGHPNFSVIALSENTKLRIDPLAGLGPRQLSNPVSPASDHPVSGHEEPAGQVDEAESAMRRALGLLGEPSRHRSEPDRVETPQRMPDRFGTGLHRRRFVQDGDVPVTVLRREPGQDAAQHRAAPATAPAPTSSRLQRAEAALAAESAARVQAERALAETQSALRDLQTKIGHADLAKNEAIEALRLEREASATLRQDLVAAKAEAADAENRATEAERSLAEYEHNLAEERQARRSLERLLRAADAAREEAERLVQTLYDKPQEAAPHRPVARPRDVPEPATQVVVQPKKRGRPPLVKQPTLELEPEPVKWWLTPAKNGTKRR